MAGEGAPTWEEVARSHGRFLYTVAYRLTGNREDAQDLVQEVLLRVGRGLETYQPGSMEGWLSRIATNAFPGDGGRRRGKRWSRCDSAIPPSILAESHRDQRFPRRRYRARARRCRRSAPGRRPRP